MKRYRSENKRKTIFMLLLLVLSTVILVFGIAKMDLVVTSILIKSGMPDGVTFVSSILEVSPEVVYHTGIGMVLGGYMLVVILFLESKFNH